MSPRTEKVLFTNDEGHELAARLELPSGEPKHYALFAHCFTCSKDVFAATRISKALTARGIAILRFDFTGLGNSEGDFSNSNFSSNVGDLVSAHAFLSKSYRAPELIVGHSLGGAAVLAASGGLASIKAVVTIAAPSDVDHIEHLFLDDLAQIEATGEAQVSLSGRTFTIKKQFIDDVRSTNLKHKITALSKPLLILHSPVDRIVSIDHAKEIYESARHPKSFVALPDADHLLTERRDSQYVADVIVAWAQRYLES